MNIAIIAGRLAHTPTIKVLPSGFKVAEFSVATNYSTKNKETDQWEQKTDWHNVKVFGNRAETVTEYLRGGDQVIVEGSMKTDTYEDKEGNKKSRSYILMNDFEFGAKNMKRDDRNESIQGGEPTKNEAPKGNTFDDYAPIAYPTEEINPDDIPFN